MIRSVGHDPRTIARDIPGVFEALFPQLTQGLVASINRRSQSCTQLRPVPAELVDTSKLQKAMLFEVAVAAAEQLIALEKSIDWDLCLKVAGSRQQRYFDARVPSGLSAVDKNISLWVARNLFAMLKKFRELAGGSNLVRAPMIPGYRWIASGVGDFSVETTLIEVKCTSKHFSSSDYRQVLMYWLLSYCDAVENNGQQWSIGVLANPRLNIFVKFKFDEIVEVVGGGKSKVELVELFSAILGSRDWVEAV